MTLKNATILITGGAGFIGSHLSSELSKHNRVIVFDNFSSAVLKPKDLLNLGVSRVIRGDILNEKQLEKGLRGIDVVFHLAVACVRLSLSEKLPVHTVNATGTLEALIAAKKNGVKRFVYVSSSEVYGSAEKNTMDEQHPISPTTVYGMSKYMGELYTHYFNDREDLPTVIVRPFNTYGPRSHCEGVYGEVIPRFAVRAVNGKQPIIFGSGTQTRDFTFVTDTVDGIIRAGQSDRLTGEAINIAYGAEVSITDIAKIICKKAGVPFRPIMKPARPNDVSRHKADISKAKTVLTYQPQVDIASGISHYLSWIKDSYPNPKTLMKSVPAINWSIYEIKSV
ncbi:MAG: hypothetical protein UW22_C0018G0007 [Candidatus Gottesmanbacteria bacterium GW2011_GWB1_44_11c]|uniref:NAD-dependent epimerase/dehydratase domain-containing protein n=1 Tax=Candidatus Gottesmanbacteria bacterium GW2011_GWB1_44_11c TaxID=1618447 RepID=A0A0G1J100_9BACT|nr:MAG: hypothetical protein UW22_C0018G0007 [Candidatus Gottesmanbacteria bacterium GW2011_GWB1_44_11c]